MQNVNKRPTSGKHAIVASGRGVFTVEIHGARAVVRRLLWSGELADAPPDLPNEVLAHLADAAPAREATQLGAANLDTINERLEAAWIERVSRPRKGGPESSVVPVADAPATLRAVEGGVR